MRSIPRDLDESAYIDGCSTFRVFWQILLPLMKSSLFSAGLFQFLWTYNDYFNSLMIVSSTLAALHKANRTGKGESIDLAMYETLLAIGQYYLVDYLNEGILWPRPGARNQNLCGIGEYKCNDGFLGVCLYGVDQNKYFLETIGLGHLWGTEDIPEDTSGLWLANPHAAEIEAAFERTAWSTPSTRSRRTSLLTASPLRSSWSSRTS